MGRFVDEVKELDAPFQANDYDGESDTAFTIEKGTIPVMISAPHAVNHFRNGTVKYADRYTGGIARFLHKATGCHVIYACKSTNCDPNYDEPGTNDYQDALKEYLEKHDVKLLIDIHGASKEREYAAEMGTAPRQDSPKGAAYEEDPSLHGFKFAADIIKSLLESGIRYCETNKKEIWKNKIFDAGGQNTVTKFISENTDTACVQLEINGTYRDPGNRAMFSSLIRSLVNIVNLLGIIDYDDKIKNANWEKRLQSCRKAFEKGRSGRGKTNFFKVTPGASDVVLCVKNKGASSSSKEYKNLQKMARKLAVSTGCGLLTASKTPGTDAEKKAMERDYCALISANVVNTVVELETDPAAKGGIKISAYGEDKDFLDKLVLFTEEYVYGEKDEVLEADVLKAAGKLINLLDTMDPMADSYDVYRLWQASSKSHIPQDKIEFPISEESAFTVNDLVHVCSPEGVHQTARVNAVNKVTLSELQSFLGDSLQDSKPEYVILTNRLIELLFGREWIEGLEEVPGLRGAPVIVYENHTDRYEIGVPKADQVNRIALSTALFKAKRQSADKYEYQLINRYSDSRIHIDVENSDYKDNGRVKSKDGTPEAKKVMMPRYYRLMMGYLEKPLKTLRAEEYKNILVQLSERQEKTGANGDSEPEITKEDFDRCYSKIPGQAYYQLVYPDEAASLEERALYEESAARVVKYLESIGAYSMVDMIRVPKKRPAKKNLRDRLRSLRNRIWVKILKITIGRAEYILKTSWAGDTDDKNSVARLNGNMMSLLGVSENDKIQICFGDNIITLRVLEKDELSDYEIGIPSSGRRALKMNSINDIVIVQRDMVHAFKRHSQEQTIAILGTVLAVAQVLTAFEIFTNSVAGIICGVVICILAIILILYLALSEERVKVK
ncbi:hypothetical protein [Butyrivibrio sp. FCS014]|uniref:hypothetical protein n=1 Tax=Butyrivibrio sp. FCS014 TaxID=1408304 RepID=UPI0004657221|nr:hypothetical protein [Butyrivibrio sp. FCS014]